MPYLGNQLEGNYTSFETQTITGDGSTGYTLSNAVANGKELLVYINNVKQEEGSGKSYTASGTTITFSDAVASTDSCYVVYLGRTSQTVSPPDGSLASYSGNASISGDLTVDTNTLFVDSSNNRVGIGTTSPEGLISLPATASDTPKFRLQSASTDTDFAISSYADANGTYVALGANHYLNSSGNDAVFETTDRSAFILLDARNAGAVTFGTNSSGVATEKMRIAADGDVTISDGDLIIGTSGHGIDFSVTADGNTVGSELFDDYEEGTWSPALVGGTGFSATQSNSGTYTKVGRLVFVQIVMNISSYTQGASTHPYISGLPFTPDGGNYITTFGYGNSYNTTHMFTVSDVTGATPSGSNIYITRGGQSGTGNVFVQKDEVQDGRVNMALVYYA